MPIRVNIPTPMRQHTVGQAVVQASGATVKTVLDDLSQRYPGITSRLFDVRSAYSIPFFSVSRATAAGADGVACSRAATADCSSAARTGAATESDVSGESGAAGVNRAFRICSA